MYLVKWFMFILKCIDSNSLTQTYVCNLSKLGLSQVSLMKRFMLMIIRNVRLPVLLLELWLFKGELGVFVLLPILSAGLSHHIVTK